MSKLWLLLPACAASLYAQSQSEPFEKKIRPVLARDHGMTDEFGFKAVENRVSERLTSRYAGRDFRLTDVSGQVVREILT